MITGTKITAIAKKNLQIALNAQFMGTTFLAIRYYVDIRQISTKLVLPQISFFKNNRLRILAQWQQYDRAARKK